MPVTDGSKRHPRRFGRKLSPSSWTLVAEVSSPMDTSHLIEVVTTGRIEPMTLARRVYRRGRGPRPIERYR